ncbi:MAG TPA: hypothetical protein VIG36_10875 [Methylocystis sp.]|jgi:hypothetical protein
MTATLTPRERELARHALGLDGRRKRSYRNRYFACATGVKGIVWLGMVERGLAEKHGYDRVGLIEFSITRSGALAALEPGESLDSEDFPG